MRIPQTPERIKEAPAQVLRAVFAGVGQVLLMTERIRRRAIGQEHSPEASGGALGTRDAPAPAPGQAEPAKAAPPATSAKAAPPATPAPAEVGDTGVLPVPHYSELSVASLRARLRGLDIAQVRDLLSYERSHEDRANVIAMFERRIAKLEQAEGADPAAG